MTETTPDAHILEFRIELDDRSEADAIAALLQRRLAELDDVEQAEAFVLEPRQVDPEAVITAIGAAVAITQTSTVLVSQLRRLIAEIKGIVGDVKPRRVVIEGGTEEIVVDGDAAEADYEAIARVVAKEGPPVQ